VKRVVVNLCWMVPGSVGGSEEYATRLLNAVARQLPSDIGVELASMAGLGKTHPSLVESFTNQCAPIRGSIRPLRVATENTWMYHKCRDADLVHHLGGHIPARHGSPTAVTIHDTQPLDLPANFSKPKQIYMRRMIPHAVSSADLICTPSRWVADRIGERFPSANAKVCVVPSTWDDRNCRRLTEVDPSESLIEHLTGFQIILYPAITHPHKNHEVLLTAVAKLKASNPTVRLVLTGGAGRAQQLVSDCIDRLALSDVVIRPGRVPESELAALMLRADVLAFPSRYEGFGLPVLEAMRCGTPVVAANATSLPEVLHGSGLLVDPDDADAWAQALEAALAGGREVDQMVSAGRKRSEHFRPSESARRLTDAWAEVIR